MLFASSFLFINCCQFRSLCGSFVAVHCFVVFGSRYHPFFSDCSGRGFISRAFSVPSVVVLGSSFIRRLRDDLRSHFDSRADDTFGLSDDANVHLHGVAGLTEFNSRGSPRRAANRRKFRMKSSACCQIRNSVKVYSSGDCTSVY